MKVGVFFGGGSFIALHAGYAKGPLAGIQFDRVYGVSAGSLWASIVGFLGVDEGVRVLSEIQKTEDIFIKKDVIANIGDTLGRRWSSIPTGYGYAPLQKLLTKYIRGVPKIQVTVSKVNMETGRHVHVTANPDGTFSIDDPQLGPVLNIQDFRDSILASCLTYPLVDAFIDHQNRGWVDGGFREGGPVLRALKDGASELHICLTGPFSSNCDFSGNANDPLSGATRLLEICANQNFVSAVNAALLVDEVKTFLYSAQGQGSSTVFNQVDIQANIKIGMAAVAIPGTQISPIV